MLKHTWNEKYIKNLKQNTNINQFSERIMLNLFSDCFLPKKKKNFWSLLGYYSKEYFLVVRPQSHSTFSLKCFVFLTNRSTCDSFFHFCGHWRTIEFILTLVWYCCLILNCFLVFNWGLRYPWKHSELFFLALLYCSLIRCFYASISSAGITFVCNLRYLTLSYLLRRRHSFRPQIIWRLRSFRFLAVKFWKMIVKNDRSEIASDLKRRMPAFRGIWCLIRYIDRKHEPFF